MTSITLIVTGASIRAEVNGILTSGMVGIPVFIRYDEAWNSLTKNLVCRCEQWHPGSGDTRTILNVGETAVVAHEIMQAKSTLYLGIEGYNADGSLVMPTTWAKCGYIQPGANAGTDSSATPTLPIWAQLQAMIGDLARLDTEAKENLVEAINEAAQTGNGSNVDLTGYVKSVNGKDPDENGNVEITAPDSSENTNGLTQAEKDLILTLFRNAAYTSADMRNTLAQIENLWSGSGGGTEPDEPIIPDDPEKTLTSISAAYSGGSVTAGTSVNALTGIVVTAHYSDGTSEAVTGYALSGEIAEGENTVTVSYEGMTTTFTVTGVAESGGGETVTVMFSALNPTTGGIMKPDGTTFTVNSGSYVSFPYIEGMFISTVFNDAWTASFPPILVYENDTYNEPEYSKEGAPSAHCTATLTGYSSDAVVYVNMYNGTNTANEPKCYYSYES